MKPASIPLLCYTTLVSRMVHLQSRKGQTLVEYALLLALVTLVTIAAFRIIGTRMRDIFSRITQTLSTV